MSERFTRIDSAKAPKSGRTEWQKLAALTDREIDQAIAVDPDAYALDQAELVGGEHASYHYAIIRTSAREWRWRLEDAHGEVLAESPRSYQSANDARKSIGELRRAILGNFQKAA